VKKRLLAELPALLPEGYDIEKHLTPSYNPWDQRLCLAPDGDFFTAICEGKSDIATDHIAEIKENGIALKSGDFLEADIIVSATGLDLNFLGNIAVTVDNEVVEPANLLNYKGMMYSGIPNLLASFGYTNASWTLRCDLTSKYLCRLVNYMDRMDISRVMPTPDMSQVEFEPLLDFSSGYVVRKSAELPKQGSIKPWVMYQNYIADIFLTRFSALQDGALKFTK
jgi:cation diffusion facilitator CzcD-associated flavoprotein CzcO